MTQSNQILTNYVSIIKGQRLSIHVSIRYNDIIGGATIVQGAIVQGDNCPRDFCPSRQLSKETIVQGDYCPRTTFVQGDYCPRRLFSKETVISIIVQGSRQFLDQNFFQPKFFLDHYADRRQGSLT